MVNKGKRGLKRKERGPKVTGPGEKKRNFTTVFRNMFYQKIKRGPEI